MGGHLTFVEGPGQAISPTVRMALKKSALFYTEGKPKFQITFFLKFSLTFVLKTICVFLPVGITKDMVLISYWLAFLYRKLKNYGGE